VGYLPEERGLYKKMTVLDVIVFFAELRGVRESVGRKKGLGWLEKMGLLQWHRSKVETLSKGMQQKVQFITAVIHEPELLILDEPGSGLDPVNQEVLRETILEARDERRTVVFSTHNMDQAEQLCDFVCIIAQGRKVLDGPLKDIRRAHAGHRYRVSFDEDTPAVAMLMTGNGALAGGSRVSSSAWDLDLPTRSHVERAMSTLASADVPVTRFEHVTPSLHQIFVEKVGNAGTAARRPEAGDA
jgi:ABC-2 type transport system ATP-binding protein